VKQIIFIKIFIVIRFNISLILLFITQVGFSQMGTIKPVYMRFPDLPQFTIHNAQDSSLFTRENLQKRKPTVFIFFSPDCEHCQQETKELTANINKFKNAQIVMITYMPYYMMVKFYKEYKIANYPLITMGRDGKYLLPTFFNVKSLPAIYVYDKKGKFKQAFEGSVKIDKVVGAL
jgi:thiol-disulfide isomerase/thioredoxin